MLIITLKFFILGEPGGTSVAPRQRPKPQQGKALGMPGTGPLPPLQPPPHPTPPPLAVNEGQLRICTLFCN